MGGVFAVMFKTKQWNQTKEALGKLPQQMGSSVIENRWIQGLLAKRWSMLIVAMGFLLGRAMILDQFVPFALAYFAVIYFLRKDAVYGAAIAIVAGSVLSMHGHTQLLIAQMLIFYLIQKALLRYERAELSAIPWIVLVTTFGARLFFDIVSTDLSWFLVTMAGIEAILAFVLTLIFLQAIPVFTLTKKNYQLKTEEVICLMILLASVMTGTVGWEYMGVSAEHVLSRYLILLFAFAGGATLGASVGVITGLILSLANVEAIYQISLLAFSGLLAGLLREGKKPGVALGMLLGSSILTLYIGERPEMIASIGESAVAVTLFLFTPKWLISIIAKYVPGTREHEKTQQDYALKVRDVVSGRIAQFSDVFNQLSSSFTMLGDRLPTTDDEREKMDEFIQSVAMKSCEVCPRRNKCWSEDLHQTYRYMTEMMNAIDHDPEMSTKEIHIEWKNACIKTDTVLEAMKQQYVLYVHNRHWKNQIQETRQLVAEQLSGVSQVMKDLSREIKREGQEMFMQEEQIRQALEDLGLSIHGIDIISLDEGNVQIEMIHRYDKGVDECRKLIAPLLTDILREHIAVKQEEPISDGYFTVEFGSAIEYEIETGIAGAAKGGELLSGDSFSTLELGNGKFAVALSDGMGNGERASDESQSALSILEKLLQSGMDEKLAIKSVNSILLLRSQDEMFATIDVALIDMYSAKTTFLKVGSTPSYIKRGTEVIPIKANNLPVGILQEIDFELVSMQLKPGDTLIMMTDGVFDAPGYAVNKDMWMKRMIQEMRTDDPQEIADCLLETVVRYQDGEIVDDMTVVVARIDPYKPEWASFRWPGITRVERPKTVS